MAATVTIGNTTTVHWSAAPASYRLQHAVHVWDITISSSLHLLNEYDSLLNAAEQKRANSYHQLKDRQRFIVSRVALRILLGRYLQLLPQDVIFTIGDNKKPFIQNTNTPLHYNVSHSGGKILIAISDHEVGIDIEDTGSTLTLTDIINTCFSKPEAAQIHSPQDFYLLWTRKEALLKATAKGIDDDIISIPCLDGTHPIPFSTTNWCITSFNTDDSYVSSAAHTIGCSLALFKFV